MSKWEGIFAATLTACVFLFCMTIVLSLRQCVSKDASIRVFKNCVEKIGDLERCQKAVNELN